MGVLIYTNNPDRYRVGDFIEMKSLTYPPTAEGITYIVSDFKPDDPLWWASVVPYRLVIVCKRKPSLKGEGIMIDWDETKHDFDVATKAMLSWEGRDRVFEIIKNKPIPLLLSWLKANNRDIDTWRRLAEVTFTLPDEYSEAILAYGVKPKRGRVTYPKKKAVERTAVSGCRISDCYVEEILRLSDECANELRDTAKDSLPKGVKKKRQKITEWF